MGKSTLRLVKFKIYVRAFTLSALTAPIVFSYQNCGSQNLSKTLITISQSSRMDPKDCDFNNAIIKHGESVLAYQSSQVGYGQSCTFETRACTLAKLSGTYQFASCTVEEQPFNEKLLVSLEANRSLDFRIPRSELEPTLRKGCICIDCTVDETNRATAMGCKYIRWANFPWVFLGQIPSEGKPYYYPNIARGWLDARNLTTTNEHWSLFPLIQDKTLENPELPAKDQKIKNTGVYYEAGIPEFATNGISNLELTADEITIVRKLTDLYHPNPQSILISATPFNNFDNLVAPATMYMWWREGEIATAFTKNGVPSLITQEGWIYHVYMGYRMIDSGAGAISLPQINLRLFGRQAPSPAQKQQGQLIVAAYIKAMKAYAKARWNRKLPFVTESIVDIFSNPQDIAPLIDLVKYQADTDLAVGGKVSSYNGQSFDCFNPELIVGDAKEITSGTFNGYRYGQLCLAKNEDSLIRSFHTNGAVGHPNFNTVNNFGIPISLELDGCMDCNPTNPNHIIHIYKRAGDTSYDALSLCSSNVRNGLTTNAQFFSLPDEQRHNTLIYMDKITKILSLQKQSPIFFMPPLRLDQNHIPALYMNNQGTPVSSTSQLSTPYNAYSLEQWNFQKNMIRYCPQNENAPSRAFSVQELSFRSYSAQNCSDDTTIENILKDRAYQTRSSSDFIKQAYQQILKREATTAELSSFANNCKQSGPAIIVSTLLQTPVNGAFMQNTPDEVITAVYTTLLNRNPDSFGLTYWRDWATANNKSVDQLRAELPFIFSGSDEFKKNHLILGCQ